MPRKGSAIPLARIVKSCPAAVPGHEYRYVPAHTSLRYAACLFITRPACPAGSRLYYREAQERTEGIPSVMALL